MNNTKKIFYQKMQRSNRIVTFSGMATITNLLLTVGFAAADTPTGVGAAIACTFGMLISGFTCCVASNYSRYYETKLDEAYTKKERK